MGNFRAEPRYAGDYLFKQGHSIYKTISIKAANNL